MKKLIALAAVSLLGPQLAWAGTGYYLISVYPDEGQKAVDFKYWNAKPDHSPPRSAPELGLSYNVTDSWYTEVSASWFKFSPGPTQYTGWEWQNDVLLTHGQYPIDVALHTTVERPLDRSEGYGLEWGPIMQTEMGRTQFNLNILFDRDYRTVANPMTMNYQWQVKYRWVPKLEFGVQGFGELGKWDDWLPRDQQSHRAGPAVFGNWELGHKQAIKYEAAYLIGTNSARSAKSVAMRIQYIFF